MYNSEMRNLYCSEFKNIPVNSENKPSELNDPKYMNNVQDNVQVRITTKENKKNFGKKVKKDFSNYSQRKFSFTKPNERKDVFVFTGNTEKVKSPQFVFGETTRQSNGPFTADKPMATDKPIATDGPFDLKNPFTTHKPPVAAENPFKVNNPFTADKPVAAGNPFKVNNPFTADKPVASDNPFGVNNTFGANRPFEANKPSASFKAKNSFTEPFGHHQAATSFVFGENTKLGDGLGRNSAAFVFGMEDSKKKEKKQEGSSKMKLDSVIFDFGGLGIKSKKQQDKNKATPAFVFGETTNLGASKAFEFGMKNDNQPKSMDGIYENKTNSIGMENIFEGMKISSAQHSFCIGKDDYKGKSKPRASSTKKKKPVKYTLCFHHAKTVSFALERKAQASCRDCSKSFESAFLNVNLCQRCFSQSFTCPMKDCKCNVANTVSNKETCQCIQKTSSPIAQDTTKPPPIVPNAQDKSLSKAKQAKAVQIEAQWDRLKEQGTNAYRIANYDKAIHYYSLALQLNIANSEKQAILYTNRAAAKMMLNCMMDAAKDCMFAIKKNSLYLKAYLRGSRCHVMLGDVHNAKSLLGELNTLLLTDFTGKIEPNTKHRAMQDRDEILEKVNSLEDAMRDIRSAISSGKKKNSFGNALCATNRALQEASHCQRLFECKVDYLFRLK